MAQQISKMNLLAQVFAEWTIEILIKCFDITTYINVESDFYTPHFITRVYTWQWLFKIFYRPTQYAFLHEGIKQIYHHFNHYLNQSKVTFVWVTIHVFRLWNNSSLKWWQRITKVFTTCIYCTSSFQMYTVYFECLEWWY